MKNLSLKQIEQVKKIKWWDSTAFHGNKKRVGDLFISDFREIVTKKRLRESAKYFDISKKSNFLLIRELINESKKYKGTSYYKILIEGNTGIYYASPSFLHKDYNKTRVFEKNEKTLKLMKLFNSVIKK